MHKKIITTIIIILSHHQIKAKNTYTKPKQTTLTTPQQTPNNQIHTQEKIKKLQIAKEKRNKIFWSSSLIFPSAGQFYNKKYWKIPIVYLGFTLTTWSWKHQNKKLKQYLNTYKQNNNPNTAELAKKARKWRTFSLVCTIFWYALVASDAYVDSQLSTFDTSNQIT